MYSLSISETTDIDGFTVLLEEGPVIFYNDRVSKTRQRFTLAHELGHLVLGHMQPGVDGKMVYIFPKEFDDGTNPKEIQANVFASRLLAPACVLWGLGVRTSRQIEQFCDIGHQAATLRMQRMNDLYQKNKFLKSPLERKVYEQFEPFIKAHKL